MKYITDNIIEHKNCFYKITEDEPYYSKNNDKLLIYHSGKPTKSAIKQNIFKEVPFELSDKRTHHIFTVDYIYVDYHMYPNIERSKIYKEFSDLLKIKNKSDEIINTVEDYKVNFDVLNKEDLAKQKIDFKRSEENDKLYAEKYINDFKKYSKAVFQEVRKNKHAHPTYLCECKCLKQVYEYTCLFIFNDEKSNNERKIFAFDDNDAKEIAENIALKNNYTFIGLI